MIIGGKVIDFSKRMTVILVCPHCSQEISWKGMSSPDYDACCNNCDEDFYGWELVQKVVEG